jgi:hypothetical protein
MKHHTSHRFTSLSRSLLILFCCLPGLLSATVQQSDSLEIDGNFRLPVPQDLRALHMERPHAAILVGVDSEGNLVDIMPYSATHVDLLEPAIKAVEKAEFRPSGDGASVQRAKVFVNFFDPEQEAWRNGLGGLPLGGTVSEAAERRIYKLSSSNFTFEESKPQELDNGLRILEARLRIFVSEEGKRQKGQCVVEYFVGPEGKVHFPKVLESDHEDLSMSALLSLETTRFEAPTRGGKPTWVKVRQPFNFS